MEILMDIIMDIKAQGGIKQTILINLSMGRDLVHSSIMLSLGLKRFLYAGPFSQMMRPQTLRPLPPRTITRLQTLDQIHMLVRSRCKINRTKRKENLDQRNRIRNRNSLEARWRSMITIFPPLADLLSLFPTLRTSEIKLEFCMLF